MKTQSIARGLCSASLLWFLVVLFDVGTAKAQELAFCAFPLSKAILQANASFNVIYELDVSEKGLPVNIKALEKGFAQPADVQACLEQWRLPQFASKHLVAVFEWHHGVGWKKLAISGPDIKLTIQLTGEKCPYGAKAGEKTKPTATMH
jgi:hypothetical protein